MPSAGEGLRSRLIVVKTDSTVTVSNNDAKFDVQYHRSTDCKRSYIEGPYKFSGHNGTTLSLLSVHLSVKLGFFSGFCPHPKFDT